MDDSFGESTTRIDRSGRIKTSSRLRRTWLTLFRGYKVEKTLKTPKGYSLGRLLYATNWVLMKKDETPDP